MWARLKYVAEWISRRGAKGLSGSIHKDSDIFWGITIVDVMSTGSVRAKGSEGEGRRPRNLCLCQPEHASNPLNGTRSLDTQWEFCRRSHFPYKSLSEKRKRDEEEEGYSCAAQWRDGEIDDKGTRRELGERGRGRGGVRCGGAGHLGWGSRECFDYSPLKLLNPLMP